jgi:hypothetical protein
MAKTHTLAARRRPFGRTGVVTDEHSYPMAEGALLRSWFDLIHDLAASVRIDGNFADHGIGDCSLGCRGTIGTSSTGFYVLLNVVRGFGSLNWID